MSPGMHRFQRYAPLDATPLAPPAEDDRTGPPLTQGFLFTMVGTVAAEHCSREIADLLARIDPDAWYHGQLLETVLNRFEDQDPGLPEKIGRNIHFMWRSQLDALGFRSARAVMESLPRLWRVATRGNGGEWRAVVGPQRAHVEAQQPYNCLFEQGTVRGLLEAYGAGNVRVSHSPCMRSGAPFCVLDLRWNDRPSFPVNAP